MIAISKGVTLIEASAGTGKTYTLCQIILRLIISENIPIDRILAITFTQAATEELNSRIRNLLRDSLEQIESQNITDESLQNILEQSSIEALVAGQRLNNSLQLFDEATIATIHGFCKRCLETLSLESGVPFDAALEPIDDELISQLKDEFIRIHILERSHLLTLAYHSTPRYSKKFKTVAKESASHPYARIRPEPQTVDYGLFETAFDDIQNGVESLLDRAVELIPLLKANSRLAKRLSEPSESNQLASLAHRNCPLVEDLKLLEDLSLSSWLKAVKKAHKDLDPPKVTMAIDLFLAQIGNAIDGLVWEYREWLFRLLSQEKERRNIVSFNDLIHLLHKTLRSDTDASLAELISNQYDAALVDEFQDTDPIQYEIIQHLFGDGSKFLFYIGDPKQAIYRFRGADIFAYFKATDDSGERLTQLSKNYRSTPNLISAVNAIFSSSIDGFGIDRIRFSPSDSSKTPDSDRRLQFLAIEFNRPEAKTRANLAADLARASATQLAKRIKNEPNFDPGKVAFLVSKNQEADILHRELALKGIDSIIRSDKSVFQTDSVDIVLQLLGAVAHPSRQSIVKALLLTPICGKSWNDLLNEGASEEIHKILDFIHQWSSEWYSSDFDTQFQKFLALTGAENRLLENPEGERLYTDLCQLSELLQSEAISRLTSPSHLSNWLNSMREENVSNREDWQSRLRSDEGKPQIITIHKSKGLQFPIVICPFLSGLRTKPSKELALYHDSNSPDSLVIDLNPQGDSSATIKSENEEYAEHLRLIYVALTRAATECLVYLYPEDQLRDREPSSISRLFLGTENARAARANKNLALSVAAKLGSLQPEAIDFETLRFADVESEDTLVIQKRSSHSNPRSLPIPVNASPMEKRVLSFSTITRIASFESIDAAEIEFDEPDIQEDSEGIEIVDSREKSIGPSIFTLPKGAITGNLLHAILESIDFQDQDAIQDKVEQAFHKIQFGNEDHLPAVAAHIRSLLTIPLGQRFSLSHISSQNRVAELEFAFPTSDNPLPRIARALRDHASLPITKSWIDSLSLERAPIRSSYLRGFIDLVIYFQGQFYILDWKSNFLGNKISDYNKSALVDEMEGSDYFLQYCLYAVALKRYLERKYPTDEYYQYFGGAFYLFIRGINPHGQEGIFFDRPNRELLDALDEALAGP